MNKFLEKIKSFYTRNVTSVEVYDTEELNPRRGWEVILFSTFIVLSLCASFAIYFYLGVEKGEFFVKSEDNSMNEVKINTDVLKKTVEDIRLRENQLSGVKQKPVPTDPL